MSLRKLARRSAITGGIVGLGLAAVYAYQPQRYDFFPRAVPNPNPPIDPDLSKLMAKGTRVAVVAAHPDDPEFYIGGLLTRLKESGAEIAIVMCTDGDKAYYPPGMTNVAENRRVRRQEQIEAARQYGAEVFFLARPDGRLFADDEVIEMVRSRLADFQPTYVLSFDPQYPPSVQHRDHLQSGVAAAAAGRNVPSVRWLGQFSTRAANHYFDITDLWPAKRRLLRIHASQFASKIDFIERMVGGRARQDGARIGVDYAEGLRFTRL